MAAAIGQLYMLATGSRPGDPISPDDLAPMVKDAVLLLGYGAFLVVLPFLGRSIIRRWRR